MAENYRVRVKRIQYRNEETKYTVFEGILMTKGPRSPWRETKQKMVFVGQVMLCIPNDKFDLEVSKEESRRYGEQYRILAYHRIEPGTIEEIKKFLMNSTKGLGPGKTAKLLEAHGLNALNVLRDDPAVLDSLALSKQAKASLMASLNMSDVFEDLLMFFRLNNLDHRYAFPIYKKYGDHAVEKLRDDPYAVYLDEVIPFQAADAAAFALKTPHNDASRVMAACLATLLFETEEAGNVYLERSGLQVAVLRYLSKNKCRYNDFPPFTETELDKALAELSARRLIREINGLIYLTDSLNAEDQIVEYLQDIQNGAKPTFFSVSEIQAAIGQIKDITLSPEQRDAIVKAVRSPVSILTGGPGTGKTQTVSALLRVLDLLCPKADTKLCAPTGKAAARMGELTGKPASTVHRMLGLGDPRRKLGIGELVGNWVIVDEFSMVDIRLCRELLKAMASSVRLVIVGDDNQLPSVGPGLVLRDFIASGVIPVTKLTKVFRQTGSASKIIHNAHAIIDQRSGQPINLKLSKRFGGEFCFLDAESPSEIRDTVIKCCKQLHDKYKLPLSEIQVLSPVHGGELGVDRLNLMLQETFNTKTGGYEYNGYVYQEGDKVIHTKNNYSLGVFNGETGVVKSIGWTPETAVEVEYKDKTVWYDSETLEELEPAYALTVHKSQGSEYSAVVIPIHDLLVHNMTMNLVYTAITRAKGKVILVGDKAAFSKAMRKQEAKRNSMLAQKLSGSASSALALAA